MTEYEEFKIRIVIKTRRNYLRTNINQQHLTILKYEAKINTTHN